MHHIKNHYAAWQEFNTTKSALTFIYLFIYFSLATLLWALRGWLDGVLWCWGALWTPVLRSLIASQPSQGGENEVEVGNSGLSKAWSHHSQSEILTPSRYLMDFRRLRQTHSWAPNKLIRTPYTIRTHTDSAGIHFFCTITACQTPNRVYCHFFALQREQKMKNSNISWYFVNNLAFMFWCWFCFPRNIP